ncbi:Actin family [Trinorchestia longiramus]|nr:Actin family [Trinorchestia longiramus]
MPISNFDLLCFLSDNFSALCDRPLTLVSLCDDDLSPVEDHVAATFGSGVGSACVVDVGDQQTSVSCVEDALSIPSSRLRLEHGGSDICQVLHWLLRKCGFPRSLDPATRAADARLLATVKHTACHVDLDKCGVQELQIQVMDPGCKPASYNIQVGDELLLAPLSLCYPALLQLTGDKTRVLVQAPNPGHSEDPFDDLYLRDTSRRGGKEASEGSGEVGDEDMAGVDENLNGRPDTCGSVGPVLSGLLSLEQAVHASIERCAEETRRRMYSCILLVGAGASFPHLGKWLQSRLPLQIPMAYRPEQLEVITRAKDLDPGTIAWKGAALMTGEFC